MRRLLEISVFRTNFFIGLLCIAAADTAILAQPVKLYRDKALEAILYLNRVRANPGQYSDSVGVALHEVQPRQILQPDPLLTQVAEERAMDMARRNYFGHTSPDGKTVNSILCAKGYAIPKEFCQYKTLNNFESICAGSESGIECINVLLRDEGLDPPGHRVHLLGLDEFYKTHTKVGAAMAYRRDTDYEYYFVIVTAP
jgi:hypothetical protein